MTAPVVTVEMLPDEANVRISVDADPAVTSITVTRTEPGGIETAVRGSPFRIDGAGVVFDYEAPFDVAITYTVVAGVDTVTSAEDTLVSDDQDWLKCLADPDLSLPVTIEDWPEKSREGRVSIYPVIGRKLPVAITDVMSAPTSGLTLAVLSSSERDQIDAALDLGYPMLLHCPPSHLEDRTYFVVNTATWSRITGAVAGEPTRRLALDITEVDSTRLIVGPTVSALVWDDIVDAYDDWDEVRDTWDSWSSLLLSGSTLPGV
jgi:hypothetical protein